MYVKVHKEGNQWFRDDGTLFGTEVPCDSKFYNYLSMIYGKKIFVEIPCGMTFVVKRGYFDCNKNFHPLGIYEQSSVKSAGLYISK